MKIVETVVGYYFYHLSKTGKNGQPTLCGRADVMQTGVPLSTWGMKTHLREKYCQVCEDRRFSDELAKEV